VPVGGFPGVKGEGVSWLPRWRGGVSLFAFV